MITVRITKSNLQGCNGFVKWSRLQWLSQNGHGHNGIVQQSRLQWLSQMITVTMT